MKMKIVLPDDVVQRLIALRDETVRNAFEIGRITHEVITAAAQKQGSKRGVVGPVVAQIARVTGRSASRVYRFLYLWQEFGATGWLEQHPVLGLSHWEMAYRLRKWGWDVVQAFVETVAGDPAIHPAEAAQVVLARLRPEEVEEVTEETLPVPAPQPAPEPAMAPTEPALSRAERILRWLQDAPEPGEARRVLAEEVTAFLQVAEGLAKAAALEDYEAQALEDILQRLQAMAKLIAATRPQQGE